MELNESFTFRGDQVRWGAFGEGEPLVLVHGWPFSSLVWRRIAPHLARRRRVYMFDLLGYGASDKHDGQDASLGIQNEVFAELLDHWQLDRPDVVAHDFGGATALRTHLLNGRDYRTLTLIDPVALSPWGSELIVAARRHADVYAEMPPFVHEAVARAYIAAATHGELDEAAMRLYLDPWLGEVGQPAFYRHIAQMDDRYTTDLQGRFDEFRCPVTILWGREDAWIPSERAYELAKLIPGADLRIVDGAGHLVQEDSPETVVATVLDALESVPA